MIDDYIRLREMQRWKSPEDQMAEDFAPEINSVRFVRVGPAEFYVRVQVLELDRDWPNIIRQAIEPQFGHVASFGCSASCSRTTLAIISARLGVFS